jgi:hypothetical protein
MCYGVENAEAVAISPKVEELKPSFNRCFEVTPATTTTYTLRATGQGEASQALTIRVEGRAARPRAAAPSDQQGTIIQFFLAAQSEVPRGYAVTLCYGVTGANRITLDPPGPDLKIAERFCFTIKPADNTTYTLTATDGARTERKTLNIRVK